LWRRALPADARWRALIIVIVAIAAGGAVVALAPGDFFADKTSRRETLENEAAKKEIHKYFQQGVVMLHAKRHDHAVTAFHKVLELDPTMPEAHVNMGFALLGQQRFQAARDFFQGALDLRKEQVNAYYGLALALDALGDRRGAVGAMRTYTHLSKPEDPYLSKAQGLLARWESERSGKSAKK
jgi:Flp pilus assembly protein TadD